MLYASVAAMVTAMLSVYACDSQMPIITALALRTPAQCPPAWSAGELDDFIGHVFKASPESARARHLIADNGIDVKTLLLFDFDESELLLPGLYGALSLPPAQDCSSDLQAEEMTKTQSSTMVQDGQIIAEPASWLRRLILPPVGGLGVTVLPTIQHFSKHEKNLLRLALVFHHAPRTQDDVGSMYSDYLAVLKCWTQEHDLDFIIDRTVLKDPPFLAGANTIRYNGWWGLFNAVVKHLSNYSAVFAMDSDMIVNPKMWAFDVRYLQMFPVHPTIPTHAQRPSGLFTLLLLML